MYRILYGMLYKVVVQNIVQNNVECIIPAAESPIVFVPTESVPDHKTALCEGRTVYTSLTRTILHTHCATLQ